MKEKLATLRKAVNDASWDVGSEEYNALVWAEKVVTRLAMRTAPEHALSALYSPLDGKREPVE